MKRYLLLAAVSLSIGLLFGTSACKKDEPGVPEAGVVDAAPVETAALADPDAGAATPLATAVKTAVKPVVSVAVAAGGPFQGTYKCFGNMVATQKGNAVDIRTFPGKNDGYSTVSCTASGDSCDGTVTEFKGGSAAGKRGAHLTRNSSGDVIYKGEGEAKGTLCKKL